MPLVVSKEALSTNNSIFKEMSKGHFHKFMGTHIDILRLLYRWAHTKAANKETVTMGLQKTVRKP